MRMTTKLGIWAAALLCCAGLIGLLGQAWGRAAATPPEAAATPADRILIDDMKQFGPLERPGVVFLHAKHTTALEKEGLSCQRCHQDSEKGMALKFKRLKDADKTAVEEVYHAECISCHKETAAKGADSGPTACGDCHVADLAAPTATLWRPIHLDRSLHYRHTQRLSNKCETCHHAYDEGAKKLVYRKGEEGACAYCHQAQTVDNRISMRLAAHQACISCHLTRSAAGKEAGPTDCLSCHDVKAQAGIRVVKDAPRIERQQPDFVLVKARSTADPPAGGMVPAALSKTDDSRMPRVAFNHKAHELADLSCQDCHHAAIDTCVSCHSSEGIKAGGEVKLADAMHRDGVTDSCIGCHHQQQRAKAECAGCHYPLAALGADKGQSCNTCHLVPAPGEDQPPLTDAQSAALAKKWLDGRLLARPERSPERIPEEVTIGSLSNQYEPVALPHRKMIYKLMDNIQGSQLAATFHSDALTLCQGCHHQSPPTDKPPRCGSCHDRQTAVKNAERPSLIAAYHQQCMTCHERMGIAKPATRDCVACHKKRQNG